MRGGGKHFFYVLLPRGPSSPSPIIPPPLYFYFILLVREGSREGGKRIFCFLAFLSFLGLSCCCCCCCYQPLLFQVVVDRVLFSFLLLYDYDKITVEWNIFRLMKSHHLFWHFVSLAPSTLSNWKTKHFLFSLSVKKNKKKKTFSLWGCAICGMLCTFTLNTCPPSSSSSFESCDDDGPFWAGEGGCGFFFF